MKKVKYGFVYLWYDKKYRRYYVGAHWGTEDDGYVCSSTWMRNSFKRRPEDFKRKILYKSLCKDDTFKKEYSYLSMIKPSELGVKYYNRAIFNSRAKGGKTKFSLETIEKMRKTALGRVNSEESKEKNRIAHVGKRASISTEIKKGEHRSPETEFKKGVPWSEERRKQIMTGKHKSKMEKLKMIDIPRSSITKDARGGTELMAMRLYDSIPADLMSNFQIIRSRLTEDLDPTKIRILWCHDLANDPQFNFLRDEGWRKFYILVFVSNWQMQTFISAFGIPYEKCLVIQNAILPLEEDTLEKPTETVRLIYTPTPHRGLELLLPVYKRLCEDYDHLHLDVFSSFALYGWDNRDQQYAHLFDACKADPKITYHGAKSNDEVRAALKQSHIFAYPSIWPETSSLCLIEAMSAGLICVHSNLAALFETAANYTFMYQFSEDQNRHAATFYTVLKMAIEAVKDAQTMPRMRHQKMYADQVYNWNQKQIQWRSLMESIVNLPREIENKDSHFVYNFGA